MSAMGSKHEEPPPIHLLNRTAVGCDAVLDFPHASHHHPYRSIAIIWRRRLLHGPRYRLLRRRRPKPHSCYCDHLPIVRQGTQPVIGLVLRFKVQNIKRESPLKAEAILTRWTGFRLRTSSSPRRLSPHLPCSFGLSIFLFLSSAS